MADYDQGSMSPEEAKARATRDRRARKNERDMRAALKKILPDADAKTIAALEKIVKEYNTNDGRIWGDFEAEMEMLYDAG